MFSGSESLDSFGRAPNRPPFAARALASVNALICACGLALQSTPARPLALLLTLLRPARS